MITVKRGNEDSSQKVVSLFLKRVKKSNLIARKRKTQYNSKDLSHLQKKLKAMRRAKYADEQIILERTGRLPKF